MPDQALVDELVGSAHGNFQRVKEILDEHPELVDASARWGETPMEAAAQMGRRDMVAYFLNRGVPLDICTAAMLGRVPDVAAALQADGTLAQATGAHNIPLMYYPMLHGEVQVAQVLLDHGVDVNAGDGSVPPLHGAVLFNRPDMVRWLLDNGAYPGLKDYNSKTALEVAEEKGLEEIAAMLREYEV